MFKSSLNNISIAISDVSRVIALALLISILIYLEHLFLSRMLLKTEIAGFALSAFKIRVFSNQKIRNKTPNPV